jgi:putative zinc finger/helix-turn-helix YgiT family protein
MICFKCNGEEFAVQTAVIRQEFRGEQLDVNTPVRVCQTCGWQTLGPGQTDELRKRTADAFRQQHGLLTSAEIVSRRKSLAMSQREFADFLRVGEASVKRWETWQVQDESNDELIRIKSDFLDPFQQYAFLAMQHLMTSHLVTSVMVMNSNISGFYPPKFQTKGYGARNEFSLLDCQQGTRGAYTSRKCFTNEPDAENDANPDFAAAA